MTDKLVRANLATHSMERLTKMLRNADQVMKRMGAVPYGIRTATRAERKAQYDALTPERLMELAQQYGQESVNEYLLQEERKEHARLQV